MIKNCIKLILAMSLINSGCSAQKDALMSNIESSSGKQVVEDSVLRKLQAENELVIAYAVENFAWARSIDYRILVQNNNEWKGYRYHQNLMRSGAGSPTIFNEVSINKTAADDALSYITENKAWEIKGDPQGGPCTNGSKKCNINDASGARLWIITKKGAINPAYYAPEFYENCCPDKQRGLFLSITKKISAAVEGSGVNQ